MIKAFYQSKGGAECFRVFRDATSLEAWLSRQRRWVTVRDDAQDTVGGVGDTPDGWSWWYDPDIFAKATQP
jgi:hypothetical protein